MLSHYIWDLNAPSLVCIQLELPLPGHHAHLLDVAHRAYRNGMPGKGTKGFTYLCDRALLPEGVIPASSTIPASLFLPLIQTQERPGDAR